MTIISPSEYDLLKSLSGYEQQLEADKIGAKYGLSGAQIVAMISPNTNINTQYTAAQTLRFAYDPTEEACESSQGSLSGSDMSRMWSWTRNTKH